MLRKILPLALVVAVGAFTYAGTTADVSQVGALASIAQADVDKGFLCGLGPAGLTNRSHATLSPSGQESLSCSSDTPWAGPPSAVNLRGVLCGLRFGGLTLNSKLTLNSTHASLWCKE